VFVAVGTAVFVGVSPGTSVFVGVAVNVGTGVFVGGTSVFVGALVNVATGVLVGVFVGPTGVVVGVLVGTTGVLVGVFVGPTGVFVGVFVGTTGVLVGVRVGVLVGGTGVLVGVFVGVLVGGTGVLVDVLVGVFVALPGQSFTVPVPMRTFTVAALTTLDCIVVVLASTVYVSLAASPGTVTRWTLMQPFPVALIVMLASVPADVMNWLSSPVQANTNSVAVGAAFVQKVLPVRTAPTAPTKGFGLGPGASVTPALTWTPMWMLNPT
jgi:hypothetical protein